MAKSPPDLEPASALAARLPWHTHEELTAIIERDRAAVREPLERRVRELLDENKRHLERIASLETALHSAERLADARFTTVQELEHKLDESRERVSEIEGKLALEFEVNSTLTGESNALRAHVAELEAQLASARDEALREAMAAIENIDTPEETTDANIGIEKGVTLSLQALHALLTSPPKSPWIPVEERIPPNSEPVQVVCNGVVQLVPWRYFAFADSWSCAVEVNGDDEAGPDAFSHWMPLPPPPAAQKEPLETDAPEAVVELFGALKEALAAPKKRGNKEPHAR